MSLKQSQFDALVRATSADLYRFGVWLCRNDALAQDLVQETYLRAWRSLDDLRDTKAAKAWLITILRREHARIYERKQVDMENLDDVVIDDQDSKSPDESTEDALIRAAMMKLEPKYREPLLLQVLGGFSCEEIARELKLSSAAVMTQLFRARQKLKVALGAADEGLSYGTLD
jgi:RNA polymerase sigma-70 factor (ECF subfamily)